MFLLVHRPSRHATTGAGPAEMYAGSNLRLSLDLVRGCPPESGQLKMCGDYVQKLQLMNDIRKTVRTKMSIQSHKTKSWYDRRARRIDFEEVQKVGFFNPQRRKGKNPKLLLIKGKYLTLIVTFWVLSGLVCKPYSTVFNRFNFFFIHHCELQCRISRKRKQWSHSVFPGSHRTKVHKTHDKYKSR